MQRILSLTSRDFLKGISISPYYEGGGVWDRLEGVDLWRSLGLLQAGYIATDLDSTGSVVTDNIYHFKAYAPGSVFYAYGSNLIRARLYSINSSDNVSLIATVTETASGGSSAQGLEIYKDYLIYPCDVCVGRYGPLSGSPSADHDGISGSNQMTDKNYHPLKVGPDGRCYVGDANELNSFSSVATAPSGDWTTGDLILQTDYVITTLENDGNYLIIGAVNYPTGTLGAKECKVYFWDTWSPSFNKEYVIPEADLTALKKHGDWIYAFTRWGIYYFNYDNAPKCLIHEGSGISNLYCEALQGAVDIWKGNLLWGVNNLWAFGTPDMRLNPVLTNPFRISNIEVYGIGVVNPAKIYVGASNKIYVFKTGNSSAIAQSTLIDLGGTFKITGIKVVGKPSTGIATISIQDPSGNNIVSNDYDATKESAFIKTKGTTANVVCDQILIYISFNGNPMIKRIDIFGEPWPITYGRT